MARPGAISYFSGEANILCVYGVVWGMSVSAVVINPRDNVAVALCRLPAGSLVRFRVGDEVREIRVLQDIPQGHKFALVDIEVGGSVIKYGEVIGVATAKIRSGEHVHVHNVESLRGRGDQVVVEG